MYKSVCLQMLKTKGDRVNFKNTKLTANTLVNAIVSILY